MPPPHRRTSAPHRDRMDWQNLRRMLPYLLDYRGRVVVALSLLVIAKLATVGVPLVLKEIVDSLEVPGGGALVLPVVLLLAYGALRGAQSVFNELRDIVFARVRYSAMHRLSLRVLEHLHRLSLRYHLERRTGAIARDLERGAQSVSSILNYLVFNIVPTIAEFVLVAAILLGRYPARFALVTFASVALYVVFTLSVTNWRMHFRHRMNALDSEANGRAVDSLLNYETVKYFTNEQYELRRYDATLGEWEDVAVRSTATMSLLNLGQGLIIAAGVTLVMFFAAEGVVAGSMTLGDLVLVNTMMLQLFMPLNFLGVVYRAMHYAFADMDRILRLLDRREDIRDAPDAIALQVHGGEIRFESVGFAYQPEREVLKDVDFSIPAGRKVAIVGPSGAGKSTLARLMFRFYDVDSGRVLIDGQDIRACTQQSLRGSIGIVPQDTVLFNETILYNIRYARPDASRREIEDAARMADIHDFIASLPQGYDTVVGERGLKLSGGEKQRVAIARVILKRPGILIFDEATSSLDSRSEQAILASLGQVSRQTTTMVIAHRLSTVIDADRILVMDKGRITEQGTHAELLEADGLYAHLWTLQQEERVLEGEAESLGVTS